MINKPRAITVAVDFLDLIKITVPYNLHHFEELWIVTTPDDPVIEFCKQFSSIRVYTTKAFEIDQGRFRKWAALEEGLDHMGRHGLMTVMDADILWPKNIPAFLPVKGKLYTPIRRLLTNWPDVPIPPEQEWHKFFGGHDLEWASYTQIFWADDPVLTSQKHWYDPSWIHAGGADSFFQARWPGRLKERPPFEVLHLGVPGKNWFGRATKRADRTIPEESEKRLQKIKEIWQKRRETHSFRHEKI